jgi:protein SSD1
LEGDVVAVELLDVGDGERTAFFRRNVLKVSFAVWGTKKEKEEKKRKKEEIASYDPRNSAAVSSAAYMRKQDKKNDDVEVEGQGMTLFDDLDDGNADDVQPQYAGHVVGVVHRAPGQLFAGTLGVLRPSSAATKEKQEAERRDREGVDLRSNNRQDQQPIRIVWLRPVDKR